VHLRVGEEEGKVLFAWGSWSSPGVDAREIVTIGHTMTIRERQSSGGHHVNTDNETLAQTKCSYVYVVRKKLESKKRMTDGTFRSTKS
jgi:hypothetical protein